jgi:hypothetical protein
MGKVFIDQDPGHEGGVFLFRLGEPIHFLEHPVSGTHGTGPRQDTQKRRFDFVGPSPYIPYEGSYEQGEDRAKIDEERNL